MSGFGPQVLYPVRRLWSRLTGRGPAGSAGLRTEVSASLPVIEVLERQILDAVEKGTSATDDLSRSFGDMAERAMQVVQMATDSRRDESTAGVEQVREVVSELLSQVRRTSDSTKETANMLAEIEKDVQDVETCMVRIEDIANRSRMVSLNGQIEAARAGDFGDGFAVVASETGDLAQNVSEASKKIREVVDRLAESLRTTYQQTQDLVTVEQEATASCEQRVEEMLTSLAEYQTELENNLESTKTSSDELAGAITRSVMTLQFQDAVSQRLHHVTSTLSEMRDAFGSIVGSQPKGLAKKRSDEWIEKIAASYCIDDERRVLTGEAGVETPSNESNIELF
ncbi:methyl-accepting chemotaxis protein [Roseiconus lacunae]|uniref:methyl-accepting chemotaxis protein n=1 Tax=Roseiconus lacunae TaxID=2605694 RepID=UPI0011F1EE3B|nr:methyl-accepting chemotaxis protein [Roseiconus lacunae]WRQ48819.1 methyl-accepting chemotaxis protein [Stieleria sp. HD01]